MLSESALRQIGKELAGRFQADHDARLWEDFQDVLATAESPNLQGAHRAAAVNALSSFWQYGCEKDARNSDPKFSSFKIWSRVFYVYLDRYHGSPPKPMKQLLVAIGKSLKDIEGPGRDSKIKLVCQECLLHVIEQEDVSKVKPALICLEYFLNRSIITTSILLSTSSTSSHVPSSGIHDDSTSFQSFVLKILSWLAHSELAPHAGRLVVACYTATPAEPRIGGASSWSETLKLFVEHNPDDLEPLELFVLPGLLDAPNAGVGQILEPISKLLSVEDFVFSGHHISEADARLSLLILQKFKSTLKSNDASKFGITHNYINSIAKLLTTYDSSQTRLAALRVLVEDHKIGTPINREIYEYLRKILPDLHYDDEPKARNDLLSIIKRLFKRLAVLYARDTAAQDHEASQVVIDFIQWYGRFLVGELAPQVPYQRHFMALKVLENLHAESLTKIWLSAEDEKQRKLLEELLSRSLLALVLDAFDDVRAGASSLLRSQLIEGSNVASKALDMALEGAETRLIVSGRADIADGAGRLYALIFADRANERLLMLQSLLMTLSDEVDDLRSVSKGNQPTFPMHGSLIKLRYLILSEHYLSCTTENSNKQADDWKSIHRQILEICQRVWDITKPILCDDSPEGQSFGNVGNDSDLEATEEKSVLSSAWRSLREASLLLSSMITSKTYESTSLNAIMELEDLENMACLLFQQLSDLRHRGAFSTVASAFNLVCSRIIASQGEPGRRFVRSLEQRTIKELQAQGSKLTRRSAGVPAMVTGILCATSTIQDEQTFLGEIFDIADSEIIDHRTSGGDLVLPQVHALNCLKDVFTNSKLSETSEPYIERALNMAVSNLSSTIWAIRNCGLMLLKALLIRIAEGNTNANPSEFGYRKKFTRRSYARYPNLGTIVINLLGKTKSLDSPTMLLGEDDSLMYATYPALEILERFGITEDLHPSIITPLLDLLESSLWLLREKAARVVSTLLDDKDILDRFIEKQSQSMTSNALHGWLLCIKHCLKRQVEGSKTSFTSASTHTSSLTFCRWAAAQNIKNTIIASTVIDIVVILQHSTTRNDELSTLIEIVHSRVASFQNFADPLLEASLARYEGLEGIEEPIAIDQQDDSILPSLDEMTISLKQRLEAQQTSGTFHREFDRWAVRLRLMIQSERSLTDRQAVIEALKNMTGLSVTLLPKDLQLQVDLIRLEALNDDDPDLRREASRIDVPQILEPSGGLDRVLWFDPRVSSQRLHQKLVLEYVSVPGLLEECLHQAVGLDYEHCLALRSGTSDVQLQPVDKQLVSCLDQENILFVIEKPNLYVDRLGEVYKWLNVFQQIPDVALSENRTHFVEQCLLWILTGVKYILDQQQDVFKIMRNQDAFVLCVRTLCSLTILKRLRPTGVSNDEIIKLEPRVIQWLNQALVPSTVQAIFRPR